MLKLCLLLKWIWTTYAYNLYAYKKECGRPEVFCKKAVLEMFQNLQRNTCNGDLFLVKLPG